MAIVPFENLSGDPGLDWMGPALARILADQLTASVSVRPIYVEDSRASRALNCRRMVQGYYTSLAGKVRTSAVLRDLEKQRNLRWIESLQGAGEAGATADALAKALDTRTRPFGTGNARALRLWGESLRAAGAQSRIASLEQAISADPNFGAAYADLIEIRMGTGDRTGAEVAAKRASERVNHFTDLDRARVELLAAGLRGDDDQRRSALSALSRLVSTDPDAARSLGDLEVNARRFDAAVAAYRSAAALDPNNATLLNQLGYAEAYDGNLRAAREALARYRALEPEALNPLDSLGEVHFIAGAFGEAEKYFVEGAGMKAGPQAAIEWLKAAQARFLQGDVTGADGHYKRYEDALKAVKNPLAEIRRAQWLWLTGRREEAFRVAEAAAGSDAEAGLYVRVQLAFWRLDAGDRAGALKLAEAAAGARSGSLHRMAAIALAAAKGGAAAEEYAEVAQLFGALAAKDFGKAAGLARALFERTPAAADGWIRTLYARALAENGKREEARELLQRNFLPLGGAADAVFTTVAYPHFMRLK